MLPFRKLKDEASISAPADKIKRKPDGEPEYDALESACEELGTALAAKDWKAAAAAWRAGFELLDSQPHEEGEHIG